MWVLLFGFLQSLWARFALLISAIVAIGMAILIAFLRGRSAGKRAYRRTHEKAQARAVERTRKIKQKVERATSDELDRRLEKYYRAERDCIAAWRLCQRIVDARQLWLGE